jgi:hypothetical protein
MGKSIAVLAISDEDGVCQCDVTADPETLAGQIAIFLHNHLKKCIETADEQLESLEATDHGRHVQADNVPASEPESSEVGTMAGPADVP